MKNITFCRSHAVACVNQFIISRTQALMLHIDGFIEVGDTKFLFFSEFDLLKLLIKSLIKLWKLNTNMQVSHTMKAG